MPCTLQTLHLDTPWTKLQQPNTVPGTDPKPSPQPSPCVARPNLTSQQRFTIKNPTQAIRNDVLSTLNYLYHTHWIDDITRHHLTPPKPACTPLFYGLPKVHNPNPLWPIVSACDSPTNQLSNYVTHFLQPLVEIFP